MLIRYDNEADAKYVTLLSENQKKGVVARTEKIKPWLLVDYDKQGKVFGVEILNASQNQITLVVSQNRLECYPVPKSIAPTKNKYPSLEIFGEPAEEFSLSLAKK